MNDIAQSSTSLAEVYNNGVIWEFDDEYNIIEELNSDDYNCKGILNLSLEKYDLEIKDFSKAIKLDSNYKEAIKDSGNSVPTIFFLSFNTNTPKHNPNHFSTGNLFRIRSV